MDGLLYIVALLWIQKISYSLSDTSCSRRDSRRAVDIINEVFVPVFTDTGHSPPPSCSLNPIRDLYRDNEKHKLQEDTNRWTCQYCGKAFLSQEFLDIHFENRHSDTINQPPGGVCLSDFCDILRCEVLDVYYKAKQHCNETQMNVLKLNCEKTVKLCVPTYLSGMKKYSFINDLRLALCDFLTCDRYDEKPIQETSVLMTLFLILVGVSFFFSAGIFFLLLFTDVLVAETIAEEDEYYFQKREENYVAVRIPGEYSELRHRYHQDYDDAYR